MRVTDAAARLGVSRQRVWQLVQKGTLARRPDESIDPDTVERYARERRVGRPPR